MSKQALNPDDQRSAACGDRELRCDCTHLFERRESPGISQHVSTSGYGEVIAAVLALVSYLARHPPYRGVIEEQGLDCCLNQIYEIVATADMRKLVCKQSLQLLRAQPRDRTERDKNHRSKPANHGGDFDKRGFTQANGPRDPQPHTENTKLFLPEL